MRLVASYTEARAIPAAPVRIPGSLTHVSLSFFPGPQVGYPPTPLSGRRKSSVQRNQNRAERLVFLPWRSHAFGDHEKRTKKIDASKARQEEAPAQQADDSGLVGSKTRTRRDTGRALGRSHSGIPAQSGVSVIGGPVAQRQAMLFRDGGSSGKARSRKLSVEVLTHVVQ